MTATKRILESDRLKLTFESDGPALRCVENKRTGEIVEVASSGFELAGGDVKLTPAAMTLGGLTCDGAALRARYEADGFVVEVRWDLGPGRHFAEQRVAITGETDWVLRRAVVDRLAFGGEGLTIWPYVHQKCVTYFARTAKGGLFTGLQLAYDASAVEDDEVALACVPSLKLPAGRTHELPPIHLGTYVGDDRPARESGLPRPCESEAMVEMTSALAHPRRHGLVPSAVGWHSEMAHFTYRDADDVAADEASLDVLADCGIDWFMDSHPWSGETEKMNALVDTAAYAPGLLERRLLEYARSKGMRVGMWPTMNNTHPWWRHAPEGERIPGRPFRPDRPDWVLAPGGMVHEQTRPDGTVERERNIEVNCVANGEFMDWLIELHAEAMNTGLFDGWSMDGGFVGLPYGGKYLLPVPCPSGAHDHLPGDAGYACQRALRDLVAAVRERFPETFILLLRPAMDLGVWSCLQADSVFTLHEAAEPVSPLGIGGQGVNVIFADVIRTWARIRLHDHFFPHTLETPRLFPQPPGMGHRFSMPWSGGSLDYIMLSALSCSPNQHYYIPTKSGLPDDDKAEIKRWLDWGRENIRFLLVRKDLPQWPAAGCVDGSAHIVDGCGFIVLFNPNKETLEGRFTLNATETGLTQPGCCRLAQTHPANGPTAEHDHGEEIRWPVQPESVALINVEPAGRDG